METIKLRTKIKNREILITLPSDVPDGEVEVTITPIKNLTLSWKQEWDKISVWDIREDDIKVKSWQMIPY
ncbi:MAG: hypothetical protein KJ666_18485 [Bacteroidetes bacterium]|nr:hypothetical protein [Bacteroidota bacterium]